MLLASSRAPAAARWWYVSRASPRTPVNMGSSVAAPSGGRVTKRLPQAGRRQSPLSVLDAVALLSRRSLGQGRGRDSLPPLPGMSAAADPQSQARPRPPSRRIKAAVTARPPPSVEASAASLLVRGRRATVLPLPKRCHRRRLLPRPSEGETAAAAPAALGRGLCCRPPPLGTRRRRQTPPFPQRRNVAPPLPSRSLPSLARTRSLPSSVGEGGCMPQKRGAKRRRAVTQQ